MTESTSQIRASLQCTLVKNMISSTWTIQATVNSAGLVVKLIFCWSGSAVFRLLAPFIDESPDVCYRSTVSQAAVQCSYIKYKNIQVINKWTLWPSIVSYYSETLLRYKCSELKWYMPKQSDSEKMDLNGNISRQNKHKKHWYLLAYILMHRIKLFMKRNYSRYDPNQKENWSDSLKIHE